MRKESKRDEYVGKLKAKLDAWNADIDRLKTRAEGAAAATRKEYQEHIGNLQARRKDFEEKLHKLGQAAESAWEDMKSGADTAAEALGAAVKSAKARFGASAAAKRKGGPVD